MGVFYFALVCGLIYSLFKGNFYDFRRIIDSWEVVSENFFELAHSVSLMEEELEWLLMVALLDSNLIFQEFNMN